MSSCIEVGASSSTDQLCYIRCNFCNIVLAVSVPCSSLCEIVTVGCGHCSNLLSVNMAAAAFQVLSTFHHHHQQYDQAPNNMNSPEYRINDLGSSSFRCNNNMMAIRQPTMIPSDQRIVNPPPEKIKQRVPSAYNQFIKEEIQRIKANNPDMSHREAFSTAAKNWAHFPHSFWTNVGEQHPPT